MNRIRFVATALSVFCFGLSAAMPVAGESPRDAAAKKGPLEVLQDCIQAVEARDFQRYVDHLAPDEVRFQAGLALTTITAAQLSDADPRLSPEVLLLSKALNDLVKLHLVPAEQRSQEQHLAAHGMQPPMQATYAALNLTMVRQMYSNAADTLKDREQFLIAVLTELDVPTEISGEQPDKVEESFDFDEIVEGFKQAKWTLYTRGDRALAVSHASLKPEPPEQPTPDGLVPPLTKAPDQLHLEFRKIDGVWKIDNLMALLTMQHAGGLAASPKHQPRPSVPQPQPSPGASLAPPRFDPYSTRTAR